MFLQALVLKDGRRQKQARERKLTKEMSGQEPLVIDDQGKLSSRLMHNIMCVC